MLPIQPSAPDGRPRRPAQERGAALLEVLITVLVVSVGLLGVAGMQLAAIRGNHGSNLRSLAVFQAYDMAERMRSNRLGVQGGSYDSISGVGSDPGCGATGCTPANLASFDHFEWSQSNGALLPSGSGTVVRNGDWWIITVRWDGDRTGANGTGCVTSVSTDLKCYRLQVRP